jgi:hypothetical protein
MLLEKVPQMAMCRVCEAANTDLVNVFQICSSTAFSLASPLVSLNPSVPPTIAGSAKRIHDHL